jgi:hypothetical protein
MPSETLRACDPRDSHIVAVDIPALKLVAFEIGMLALSNPERARLRGAFEFAGVELVDDDGIVKRRYGE